MAAPVGNAAYNGKGMDLESVVQRIEARRCAAPPERSLLVALSGIDGSGKGHVSAQLVAALESRGYRVAGIGIDGWLNLPQVRFSAVQPAEHFFRYAIRFDALFDEFILPLRDARSIRVAVDHAEETATTFSRRNYHFDDIDIILLEGIYLLRRAFVGWYDLTIRIACSLDTALERAISRAQEGLPPDETIRAYETIYLPAQQIHFREDDPAAAADLVLVNDHRPAAAPVLQCNPQPPEAGHDAGFSTKR
ncbi:MAG: uridine kinase [Gemmatimonadetes bacterium]|nr:uridine kinase [Gemmatimonadota bacterium]